MKLYLNHWRKITLKMKIDDEIIHKFEKIADIGAKDASEYLSTMTGKKVKVDIPWVSFYDYEKVPETAGKRSDVVSAIFMEMSGDIKGVILMLFPEKSAVKMAALLQHIDLKKAKSELDDIGKSALMEVGGNILANAYLNAFGNQLKIKIFDSVPQMTTDMLGSVMDGVLGVYSSKSEKTIVFKNNFKVGKESIEGYSYILFHPDSLKFLVGKLKHEN